MTLPVTLRPEAEDDLISARDWLELQQAGVGLRFVQEVASAIDRIASMPQMYASALKDVRSCQLHSFPYRIYYRILPSRVHIIAIMHGSRDPVAWLARTRN